MKETFAIYPQQHILPYDGMSINASVWGEAHGYHTRVQNASNRFLHGAGIVTGLEVIASDPADHVVYVLPGVAIDNQGQMIVLPEPVAYDFGDKIAGALTLYLLHREVKSQEGAAQEDNLPAYMRDEYVIIARGEPLEAPHVEIARLRRDDPRAAIVDANDADAPQANAIDLRFRVPVCPPPHQQLLAGIASLGAGAAADFVRGLANLSRPLAESSPYRLIAAQGASLTQEVFQYGLLYLVWDGKTPLGREQAEILQAYLQEGGKVLLEAAQAVDGASLAAFLKPLKIGPQAADYTHPAFRAPNLFLAAPQGAFPPADSALYSAPGMLIDLAGHGLIWAGSTPRPEFTREVVRSSLEWGANLIACLMRG